MSVIDVDSLLVELSEESPCGDDLEYDPQFVEMEQAAKGKPAQQMGEETTEAEEPDWRSVQSAATELFGRSRDLRVAVYLARSVTHKAGLPGLSDGLALVRGLIERHWEGVHPQLDPDDFNDPTMRVNILVTLCDPDAMLGMVRDATLVEARGIGKFSYHHIEIANGLATAPEDMEVPEISVIDGAFLDCDLDELQAAADGATQSVEHIQGIDTALTAQVGATQSADFSPLSTLLASIQGELAERLARRGVGVGVEAPGTADGDGTTQQGQPIAGEITCREDVVRMLDKACDYLDRHEPSSPVPLLLRRAKRLISKSFLDIMRDMAPDGVAQAETIGGVTGSDESEY